MFAPLADLVELLQDRIALAGLEPLDTRRHEAVDEQRLAASVRMRDEHRVMEMRDVADVGRKVRLLGTLVLVDVQRLLALELLLEGGRHRLIGFVHVAEHRIAAGGWQLERMQEGVFVGARRIAGIDVEPELAVAESADRLAVDLDIGDQEDLLVVLLDALGAAAQRRGRHLAVAELAEIGGEAQLLILGDALAAEHQNEVLPPRVLDRPHGRFGQLLGEINPADLRAAGARERHDREIDDVLHEASLLQFDS
jgi:hypothetical protein